MWSKSRLRNSHNTKTRRRRRRSRSSEIYKERREKKERRRQGLCVWRKTNIPFPKCSSSWQTFLDSNPYSLRFASLLTPLIILLCAYDFRIRSTSSPISTSTRTSELVYAVIPANTLLV